MIMGLGNRMVIISTVNAVNHGKVFSLMYSFVLNPIVHIWDHLNSFSQKQSCKICETKPFYFVTCSRIIV